MHKSKIIGIIAGIAVVLIAASVAYMQPRRAPAGGRNAAQTPAAASSTALSAQPQSATKQYMLAHVAAHKDAVSCWSVVNGGVYDLTAWIAQHPGGSDKILGICGKDGSAAFNEQHDGAKKQADILATFKIGVLVK